MPQNPPELFSCRVGCGACCIAISISSPIPGMPEGKPAGVRCVQLDEGNLCKIYGHPDRPAVCGRLRAEKEMCGDTREEALAWLGRLERLTST
ncbi:MAG: YkgJ family cysteine cluster protein [Spirochaetia bacterium]|nr:YkgJ family cysteine cluster protein [Spirochaetia bacterium]